MHIAKYRNEQKSARFHIVTYIIKANAQLLDFQSKSKLERVSNFNSRFIIVAPQNRKAQFDKVISRTAFKDFKERVSFSSYEAILKQYELMCAAQRNEGFI